MKRGAHGLGTELGQPGAVAWVENSSPCFWDFSKSLSALQVIPKVPDERVLPLAQLAKQPSYHFQ